MKPVINLDELVLHEISALKANAPEGYQGAKLAPIGPRIGAQKLGYNLTVLPPGKVQCPFHSHRGEEEVFFILEGEGELRFGDRRYPIRRHDVIACPPGGPEVAHQIINTGSVDLRYLALSNVEGVEVCEYPDSGKVGVFAAAPGAPAVPGLRRMFRDEASVDYYDRESLQPPQRG